MVDAENYTVIIADDDPAICMVVQETLSRAGYKTHVVGGVVDLLSAVRAGIGDIVISDVMMKDGNGIDALCEIKADFADMPVIIMSAHSTLSMTVKATQVGAFEYIPKPFDISDLRDIVDLSVEKIKSLKNHSKRGASLPDLGDNDLVGQAPVMQDLFRSLARSAETELSILVSGETGTGKELIARSIHHYSARKDAPFVAVNMGAIPSELIESTLFGHEKGAFSGATHRKSGHFEQANGGTLFLDEVGDMPLSAQTRLLRVLQEGEYTLVGGVKTIKADVRIIAATHKNLEILVKNGEFREDLFYRLNVVPLRVPSLRERPEDIPALIENFVRRAPVHGLPNVPFDKTAVKIMCEYPWYGNVRELENVVNRLLVKVVGKAITAQMVVEELAQAKKLFTDTENSYDGGADGGATIEDALLQYLSPEFAYGLPDAGLYDRVLADIEKPLIERTLSAVSGNQIRASQVLGLNRNTLRKKIKELGIQVVRSSTS